MRRLITLITITSLLLLANVSHAAGCINGTDAFDDNINCTTGDTVTGTPHGINARSGNNTVTVDGSASLTGTTGDGILSENGNDTITVTGSATVTGNDDGIQIGGGTDTVTISGSAVVTGTIGIYSSGMGVTKSVTITDNATINATLDPLRFDATTNDTLTLSGTATINGGANIQLGNGDDRVVLAGGASVNVTINGGTGNDTLAFDIVVPTDQLAALQTELATRNPAGDNITINGRNYVWIGFETLEDNLTAGTPPPPPPPGGGISAPPAPAASVPLFLDDRINRTTRDIAPPVAVYQRRDVIDVYAIDPFTSVGTLLIRLDIRQIDAMPLPQTPMEIGAGVVPATGRPVTMYLLPTGEIQLNSTYYDLDQWKPYVIVWRVENPDGLYHIPS